MPRSRCLRSNTVNTRIGRRKTVEPAATAGQSCPPSPMMIGMKGGAVCAVPEVSSTANAYSFQAKIRQKMAVAAGTTLFLLPILVFTILLRKHLLRGITFGAVRK